MANFVQILQRVLLLLLVVILTSGITDSVAEAEKCPMHAGLIKAKAWSLQRYAKHLNKTCEQVNMTNMLTSNDFKKIKNKDLCTLLRTYFQFYMSLPQSQHSKRRDWSKLMNTMKSSMHTFKTCEESCNRGNGRSQQLLKKQIKKIKKLQHELLKKISGNGRRSTRLEMKNNGNVGTKHNKQRNGRLGHKKAKQLATVKNALCELQLLLNHISNMFKRKK